MVGLFFFQGFFVIISPSFVIGNEVMPIPSGGMGRAFCFLIQRNFFVWLLAKYSISIAMCMAIERWYALARPAKYKVLFSTQKVLVYAALLFCVTLVVTMPTFFQTFSEDKGSETICVDRPLMGMMLASQVFTVIYCIITVFAPFLVIAVTYFHLKFYIIGQQSPPQTQTQKSRRQVEIMLSRMSAAIALVLLICIFPSQVTFILFNFNLTSWDVVNVSSTWSMFNSVANPFIYCLTNKVYRKEFAQLFCPCKDSGVMAVGAEECDDTATTNGATFQLSSEAVRKEGINPTVLSITKEP